jgi:predicted DNA-binding transcriptional regulator YafY
MMLTEEEAPATVSGLLAARKLGLAATTAGVEGAIGKLERVLPLALRETVRAVEEASVLDLRAGSGETVSRVVMTLSDAASRRQHRC